MSSIFHQRFCMLPADSEQNRIPLFNSMEELTSFQYRMGLECLCQNVLFYPRYIDGSRTYEKVQSPRAENFYHWECLTHCTPKSTSSLQSSKTHDWILEAITRYFCERLGDDYLDEIQNYRDMNRRFLFLKMPYDESCPWEYYIEYRCPFIADMIEFAFPIYVENQVVAVLFAGPFFCTEKAEYMNNVLCRQQFNNPQEMDAFLNQDLLPIVRDFQEQAKENLHCQREKLLENMLNRCISDLEEEMVDFLLDMSDNLLSGYSEESLLSSFWETVKEHLNQYLEEIGVKDLILFISPTYAQDQVISDISGIRLVPVIQRLQTVIFKLPIIMSAPDEQNTVAGTRALGYVRFETTFQNSQVDNVFPQKGDLLRPLFLFPADATEIPRDYLVHLEKIQPFALAVCYKEDSVVARYSFNERKMILRQLDRYFEKAALELSYFSIRASDYATKSVLRIYRHEITHQVSILQRNNWFLNPDKLRRTDDAKLRKVEEDQRQCINELDFMTQSIDVMTGRISDRIQFTANEDIHIRSQLFNRIRSLYGRKTRDKGIEIVPVQYNTRSDVLRSRLELLDLIFFNLMNNAIKYCYRGTRILIQYEDIEYSPIWWEKHIISFTDFGAMVDVEPTDPERIFNMNFRANKNKHIEGAGIGLYVAKTISNLLDARIVWKQEKLSDYNIPMLIQYHLLRQRGGEVPGVNDKAAEAEYVRLEKVKLINRVCSNEYLKGRTDVSRRRIQGELLHPTYEVTFALRIGDR